MPINYQFFKVVEKIMHFTLWTHLKDLGTLHICIAVNRLEKGIFMQKGKCCGEVVRCYT
jgi:hypothetical protein